MKEITTISQAVAMLEKMYVRLNVDFFDGGLETPIITVQSTPTACGHVTTNRVWNVLKDSRLELNIGAEHLGVPIEEVTDTLLHEMVHIYHIMNGIQDTSRGGTYHNKKFKAKAESIGLNVDYDKKYGWALTTPSPQLCDYVKKRKWTDIPINRNEVINTAKGSSRTSSTRKLVCPCCGNSVRATKDVYIICGDCKERMETDE